MLGHHQSRGAPRRHPHPPSHLGGCRGDRQAVASVSWLPMSVPRLASASVLAR